MKIKRVISIIFYILAIAFILIYVGVELMQNVSLSELGRLFLLCGSCLFLYFGALIKSKNENNNKAMKINLWIFFILYLLLFITLTLFDQFWGRNGLTIAKWNKELFNNYISNSLNIIPFKTIIEYIKAFDSLLDTRAIMTNLLGNIVACMPFAFFLPLLFKKQNNIKIFTITMFAIVLLIELLQFATLSGSCDIDDIILNVFGALIMYAVLKIKSVNNLIKNIFLLERNKVEKKSIIIMIICLVIIMGLGMLLIKSRQDVFDSNYNELMSTYNFTLEIVDESEATGETLEQFYEDEYHTYYFNSIKSDKVYAIINNNEKYLVKDLLNNNPTKYKITISKLEEAGLEFITENKYEEIVLKGKGNVNPKINIEDENIIEIGYGKYDVNVDVSNPENSDYEMQFFIVPLKNGNTEFEIKLLDNKNNDSVVSVKNYKVEVDNDLNVKYQEVY